MIQILILLAAGMGLGWLTTSSKLSPGRAPKQQQNLTRIFQAATLAIVAIVVVLEMVSVIEVMLR